ncbi:MAG: 50S ribosomal protein L19e [Candidatus Aenigmarchaeota archaeon]|nr:50S ribosomal protein L19e [Candidatus Aenigmarchaeota archaeon]
MKQSRTSNSQRRIAAQILKCGMNRIWMDPDASEKIGKAITRRDIRGMIADGLIKKPSQKKSQTVSVKKKQREGSRKGAKGARGGKKTRWLKIVRPQRRLLKELKASGDLSAGAYREIYRKIKGNVFRSKAHLMIYLKNKKLLKEKKTG